MPLIFWDKASGIALLKSIKICWYDFQEWHDCDCEYCDHNSQWWVTCMNCNFVLVSERDYKWNEETEKYIEKKYDRICPKCKFYLDNEDTSKQRIMWEYGILNSDINNIKFIMPM